MKPIYYILFILLISISSCNLASFTARPGVVVDNLPSELYGSYQFIEKENGMRDTHVLVIDEKGAKLKNEHLVETVFDHSDSMYSVSHLGDFYYVNIIETDSMGKAIWFVYPFEFTKNNLYVYNIILSKKRIKRMKRCGLETTGRRKGEYIMDNKAFKKYCERYLKHKHSTKFTRIK